MFEIYRLVSPSLKSYIGLTSIGFRLRYLKHLSDWRINKQGNCTKLCNAFKKYHPSTWAWEILYTCSKLQTAQRKEIEYIQYYDSINNGYNILLGGTVHIGYKRTEATKEKMRQYHLGLRLSEETKEKIRQSKLGKATWTGKRHSDETKQKMRDAWVRRRARCECQIAS